METGAHLLKVGDFVLNTSSRKLFDSENKEVSLSPTLYTLLKFFIDHQNSVLTKDMIITHVWKGKTVVDANVNQNIKKLRDTLGDSASDPKYIETVTGEGFRFVANSEEYKAVPFGGQALNLKVNYFYVLLIFVLIGTAIYLANKESEQQTIRELYPLTTLKGLEHHPEVSSDNKFLLFSHKNRSSWDIYLKPLNQESYYAVVNSEQNEMFPVLSPSGTKLIYYLYGADKCGLYIRDIDLEAVKLGEETPIKLCRGGAQRLRAEWKDEDEIFIAINEDMDSPASIYHYNLNNKQQSLISKPDSKGFGDYAFKYSKKFNKLAYIRDIGWSSSEIWIYDVSTGTHKIIKSMPWLLDGLDWDADGALFFQSGNKEISKISADGSSEKILTKFLLNIYTPFLVSEDKIGVVIGEYFVIDVGVFDIEAGTSETLISSSFNDYLAAGGNDFVTFISNRSGEPQIWMRNAKGSDIQLTQYDDSFEIKWLSASPNGDLIMYNKSGTTNIIDKLGNVIFNSENYSSQVHNNPVFDVKNDRFIYSIQYEGEWSIESRKLSSLGERATLFKGIAARPCINEDCLFYFKERDPYIYKYIPKNNSSIQVANVGALRKVDEWDVYDENHILYLEKNESINRIIKLNIQSGDKVILLESKVKNFSFDKVKKLIYTNIVSEGNIDIMYFNR
ncbi:winged helix-turn-helix domain-containing protein [Aliikangiella coralliicola]|uniref:OmpR/PhoB-type domain-containing protein n=1 Tax=Aliikangiella coralliicola TaxID=2592383 RepID=A0A545UHV1_9GAMM|nr:winged helix-turn-helix domain-containing protein [Aliikangiella coralliicola]TQV89042.1 hypothetical protein FLL46_05795 [Aliikangiella coralliicola]